MKYYKLIGDDGGYAELGFEINKIYPGDFKDKVSYEVEVYAANSHSKYWREVPAGEYYLQEGKMPEYFAIERVADNPLWKEYIKWLQKTYNSHYNGYICSFYYGDEGGPGSGVNCFCDLMQFKNNPVELTLDQWNNIVNKKDMKEKEIVAYKLLKDLPDIKAGKLGKVEGHSINFESDIENFEPTYYDINYCNKNTSWFEPIYKNSTPDITINGYKGEFFDWGVKFGCAEIDKEDFTELWVLMDGFGGGTKSNKGIEAVTIGKGTFSKEQIKQIAEYYLQKQ